jgi:beta-galactosidase
LFAITALVVGTGGAELCRAEGGRQRVLFDAGWVFHRGDAPGAEATAFNATGWRPVNLPHDWAIEPDPASKGPRSEGLFNPDSPSHSGNGYLPGGVGWYRKTFTLPDTVRGKRISLEFEGVYMDSDVWVNGQHLGNRPYGYSTFVYDVTDHLSYGDGKPNVLAVRVNVPTPSSRWYSGAGIYRHVWLTTTDPVHVAHWGVFASTPRVAPDSADVRIRTVVRNEGDAAAEGALRTTLIDPTGREVGSDEVGGSAAPGEEVDATQVITVADPVLWSTNAPKLYTAVTQVVNGGKVVDEVRTPFGIRSYEFTKDRGFLLNGKRVPIRGVCQHHDQGYLGAAAFDRAIGRQLEILKAAGCNAIRTSHNPPAPKLLELCDRMGFLVMDEAFDCWNVAKEKYDYGRFFLKWHERDLGDLVKRDRNHPSVILWSIGNEIPNITTGEGAEWANKLAEIVKDQDRTRPVSAGCNAPDGTVKGGAVKALDVFGINYNLERFDAFKDRYPLFSSESASTVSARGEYNLLWRGEGPAATCPAIANQVSAYDVFVPDWATHAEQMLLKLRESPWIAGEFVWTGFDYIGEPTPFAWPSVVSYFGFIDLCGFPKDRFYLYQSQWTDAPMVHILPHWNWPGYPGVAIPVWAYSNAEEVELFLNGKSLGAKRLDDTPETRIFPNDRKITVHDNKYVKPGGHSKQALHFAWDVPWQPGELRAEARHDGKVVATDVVRTAGEPAKVRLSVDRSRIAADGQDLAFVTVEIVDAQGVICPEAFNLVRFAVTGPATLAAVGNGDSTSHADFQADHAATYHGKLLAIVRAGAAPGAVALKATSDGLEAAELTIEIR